MPKEPIENNDNVIVDQLKIDEEFTYNEGLDSLQEQIQHFENMEDELPEKKRIELLEDFVRNLQMWKRLAENGDKWEAQAKKDEQEFFKRKKKKSIKWKNQDNTRHRNKIRNINDVSLNSLNQKETDKYKQLVQRLKESTQKFTLQILGTANTMMDNGADINDVLGWIDVYLLASGSRVKLDEKEGGKKLSELDKAKAITRERTAIDKCYNNLRNPLEMQVNEVKAAENALESTKQTFADIKNSMYKNEYDFNNILQSTAPAHMGNLMHTYAKKKSQLFVDMTNSFQLLKNMAIENGIAKGLAPEKLPGEKPATQAEWNEANLKKVIGYVQKYLTYANAKSIFKRFPGSTGAKRISSARELEQSLQRMLTLHQTYFNEKAELKCTINTIKQQESALKDAQQKENSINRLSERLSVRRTMIDTKIQEVSRQLSPEDRNRLAAFKAELTGKLKRKSCSKNIQRGLI